MRIRSKITAAALTTGLALVASAGVAHAEVTTATFTITGGSIAITVPATASLGTVATGAASASGQLGPVSVVDSRGLIVNSWVTTVTSSAFVTGTSTPDETVAAPLVTYVSGATTAHTGLGVFVPGTKLVPIVYTGAAGNSSTTWNPTVAIPLASSQVAGVYTGTITHSLA